MPLLVVVGSTAERALELTCPRLYLGSTVEKIVGGTLVLHHSLADASPLNQEPSLARSTAPFLLGPGSSPRHIRGLIGPVVAQLYFPIYYTKHRP